MSFPCHSVVSISVSPSSLCCQCQSLATLFLVSVSALSLWHCVIHPCRFLLVGAPVQTAPTSTLHPSRDSLPLPFQCSCSQLVNAHALSWLEAVGLLPAMLTALPPCVAFHSSHDYSSRLLLYSVAIPIPSPIPYSGRGRGADKPRPHLDRSAFVWKPGNTNKPTHIRQVEQRMANQPRLASVQSLSGVHLALEWWDPVSFVSLWWWWWWGMNSLCWDAYVGSVQGFICRHTILVCQFYEQKAPMPTYLISCESCFAQAQYVRGVHVVRQLVGSWV